MPQKQKRSLPKKESKTNAPAKKAPSDDKAKDFKIPRSEIRDMVGKKIRGAKKELDAYKGPNAE